MSYLPQVSSRKPQRRYLHQLALIKFLLNQRLISLKDDIPIAE